MPNFFRFLIIANSNVQLFRAVQIDISVLIATLKPQSNGPSYSNTVIGTLAVDGWAVTFATARRAWAGPQYQLRIIRCGTIIAFGV